MAAELTNQDRLNLRRSFDGPAFLKEGFRPLFLAAGVWAAISVPLWIGILSGTISYTGAFGPVIWHVHEMLFGFVAAALGGFLLTAVPNWTGRLPVRGVPLACLAGLWLAGRVAVWFSGEIGTVAAATERTETASVSLSSGIIGAAISGPSFLANQLRVKLGTIRPPISAISIIITAIPSRWPYKPVSATPQASR